MNFSNCENKGKGEINRLVKEWGGKEISFPLQSVFTVQGKDTIEYVEMDALYKILLYVDTVGCTSCKLKLSQWSEFIEEVDSLSNGSIPFYFYLFLKDIKEIQHLLRKEDFTHPVCIDMNDDLNKLNHFPQNEMFHAFLLDKDNKVLVVGNPIHNPAIKKLYIGQITRKKSDARPRQTQIEVKNSECNLGEVSLAQGEKEAVFVLKNTGMNPLLITDIATTCGCTKTDFEKKPVAPGKETKITVHFTPEEEGFFHKVVTVHCNAAASPFKLHLKGMAVTP